MTHKRISNLFQERYFSRIIYANAIITDKVVNRGEKRRHYILKQWERSDEFDILDDMSEFIKLVQLMGNPGNVSRYVTISGVWIFDANSKRALHLVKTIQSNMCSVQK